MCLLVCNNSNSNNSKEWVVWTGCWESEREGSFAEEAYSE